MFPDPLPLKKGECRYVERFLVLAYHYMTIHRPIQFFTSKYMIAELAELRISMPIYVSPWGLGTRLLWSWQGEEGRCHVEVWGILTDNLI